MTELRVIDGEGHRPWPCDRFGRALPRRPVRGLRLDVGLDGWEAWLLELLDEGPVVVHLPGCAIGWCHGCDGSSVRTVTPPHATPLRLLPSPGDDT